MTTLVIDTGQDIVGIFSVEEKQYIPYRGDAILFAIHRIETADEVVTYNGNNRDLEDMGKFAGVSGDLPLKGVHIDIRSICWSDRIWGSDLSSTYFKHFKVCRSFPDTYEGSNERDVYMTFKLWELWKQGNIKILDGQILDNQ
jgi:hypothetical protein